MIRFCPVPLAGTSAAWHCCISSHGSLIQQSSMDMRPAEAVAGVELSHRSLACW